MDKCLKCKHYRGKINGYYNVFKCVSLKMMQEKYRFELKNGFMRFEHSYDCVSYFEPSISYDLPKLSMDEIPF